MFHAFMLLAYKINSLIHHISSNIQPFTPSLPYPVLSTSPHLYYLRPIRYRPILKLACDNEVEDSGVRDTDTADEANVEPADDPSLAPLLPGTAPFAVPVAVHITGKLSSER